MEIQDKITTTLKEFGQAMRPGELADKAGLDKKDVEKAIKKMKEAGTIHSPKRCFYDIVR